MTELLNNEIKLSYVVSLHRIVGRADVEMMVRREKEGSN